MQPIQHRSVQSHKVLHKLSAFNNINTINNINNINNINTINSNEPIITQSTRQTITKHSTLKTIKTLKAMHQLNDNNQKKHLSYFSSSSPSNKNITSSIHNNNNNNNNNNINNLYPTTLPPHTPKHIHRLSQLFTIQHKVQQHFQQIDNIFCHHHIILFQQLRTFLTNIEYHQLINKCQIINYQQNKIISKKCVQDGVYFVLVDGEVSYNQQKLTLKSNILKQQQDLQYIHIYNAQKGTLLNPQTLTLPKHNVYTLITHTPTTLISFNSHQTYSKLLKKYFIKLSDQLSSLLSSTPLFRGISILNIKKLLPYFFTQNYYKFNQVVYNQGDKADCLYWVVDGEVQLNKQEYIVQNNNNSQQQRQRQKQANTILMNTTLNNNNNINNNNKKIYKIVKLSRTQIFGIDQYPFQSIPSYLFTAIQTSQSLKTICISYKSLAYIQSQYPCINQNIDFYLKRATAMHAKLVEKNHRLIEIKRQNLNLNNNTNNINIRRSKSNNPKNNLLPISVNNNKDNNTDQQPQKKKKKRNKKNKKKNPSSMQWWGLAQNNVGAKKYKLQLPKFITLQHDNSTEQLHQHSKTQPMFDSSNYRSSKIEEFKRKLFQQDIEEMIKDQERKKSPEINQDNSPFKVNYVPKINKLKIKMLDVKPKTIDQTQKVKKKLLSYAKNITTFCDKLNLD